MMRRLLSLALLLGGLFVLAAPAGPAAATTTAKTGLAVMSPWTLAKEAGLTDAQRIAFEDRMVADLIEAKVKLVRLEIAAPGSTAVDLALYRRLLDKLPSDVKVVAVLNFALVEGGVTGGSEPYLYELQDSPAVTQYPEYGTTTQFMKVWLDKALAVTTAFKSRLAAVEVLNEANKLYHPGTAAHPGPYVVPADAYGRLLAKFYRYCRLAGSKPCGSTVKVITHGMHPAMDGGDAGSANDDVNHLRAVLASPSIAGFRSANSGKWPFDGIGYHPYPFAMGLNLPLGYANTDPATLLTGITGRLDAVRTVLNQAGVPAAASPFWLTEVGFNSNDVNQPALEDKEARQGLYLALADRADTAQAIWYRYHEGDAAAPAENWGLVAHDGRSYATLPPRYKRAFCDFVWSRGVGATAHCPQPNRVTYQAYFNNVLYPASYWEFPQYVVDGTGSFEVQQDLAGATRTLSGYCSTYDPYGCSTADYSRFPVPSTRTGPNRFRVRSVDYPNPGPWSDWMTFTPLIGSTAGIYGPAPGTSVNLKTQYVAFPVAVPTQWLLNHPTGVPYVRFHETLPNGGWVRTVQRFTMPSVPSDYQQTSDHALHVFGVSITANSSASYVPGQLQVTFGIAPAACRDDWLQCIPINAAESITTTFNHT